MINIGVMSTVLVALSSVMIFLWVFRPNSKAHYKKMSEIPLREERSEDESK